MRSALAVVPGLLVLAAFPLPADNLPAYCGPVGAKSYTPPVVNIPPVVLNRGTVITVTNATMVINGDTSSVKALVANPGADGISLQEAIIATNNNPGTWNIQFAAALKGSTIQVDTVGPGPMGLSQLSGGNVTINGDIDGHGQPGITLASMSGTASIFVFSGGNTLNGLAMQGCGLSCVMIRSPAANGKTFSNTTVSNLVMSNLAMQGVGIDVCPNCGATLASPTGNTWDHVLITGNTIAGTDSSNQGIRASMNGGGTLQHTIIAKNNISIPAPGIAIGVSVGNGIGDKNNRALDTLIANNIVQGAIRLGAGGNFSNLLFTGNGDPAGGDGGSDDLIDGMQLIGNEISGGVIGVSVSDTPSNGFQLPVIQYAENNIVRNISILANTVRGPGPGITIYAASGTARNDVIANLSILGNTLMESPTNPPSPTTGIGLEAGGSLGAVAPATGNSLSNVLIQANSIQNSTPAGNVGNPLGSIQSAGIYVVAGATAPGNSVNGISIANNDVNTPFIGIGIVGGNGTGVPFTGPLFSSDNNVVSAAQIFCNQVDQALAPGSGVNGINVTAALNVASGNQVSQLYVADNLIGGVLAGASTSSYLGTGGSGNTLTTTSTATPAISFVANAEGESPVIAPNTWIEIKGVNLAPHADALALRTWTASDFVNGQMPVALDNVGVTVNGKRAYVFYVSPSQINVLTPPDAITGPVDIIVTNNGVVSAKYSVQSQALSPSFFVFDGAHVIGAHLDGTDIGPATLYPGLTTPAKPGETIVLFANGFGTTSTPVVTGSQSQSGTLSPLPIITIGGIQATVRFAGLNIAPGQFQFNVDVPVAIPDGDQPIVATYNGLTTQALLAVQHD